MSVTNLLVPCPNIQDLLKANFQTCTQREPMPFLEFLTSPANNYGLQQKVSPGKGKLKNVELTYLQRLLEGEVEENVTNPMCTSTTERGNEVEVYELDPDANVGVSQKFTLATWRDICEDPEVSFIQQLERMQTALMAKVATKTANQAPALIGGWNSNVDNVIADELIVKTLKTVASGDIAPFTMQDIDMAFMQSGWCAGRAIFSGTDLYKYYGQMLAGCCASMGVDLRQIMDMFGWGVAYDKRIATAFGGNDHALAVQLGALALLHYNVNDVYDDFDLLSSSANYYHTKIFDPGTGLPMDLNMKNDCGNISIQLVATTTLVALPKDMFQATDENDGVNYAAEIKVTNT